MVVPGLDEAVKYIEGREDIESTWVIGGSSIYAVSLKKSFYMKTFNIA